jgi:hypothetical protein
MAFTTEEVLEYLSGQGFKISMPRGSSISLIDWNNLQIRIGLESNEQSNALVADTESRKRGIIVRPVYEDIQGQYLWRPNIRQFFSELEIAAGNNGSLIIDSQKPLFHGTIDESAREYLGRVFSDNRANYEISLLRTVRD